MELMDVMAMGTCEGMAMAAKLGMGLGMVVLNVGCNICGDPRGFSCAKECYLKNVLDLVT